MVTAVLAVCLGQPDERQLRKAFEVWMTLAITQLSTSLVFDLRDGAKFLVSFL